MNVALYARYSSDQQRETSIEDQLALCRQYAERQRWRVSHEYTDARITGATLLLRPGIQRLMHDAGRRYFDVLLAESLDRFSRDQEDTAALFKRLRFAGVRFVTLAEGEITELHVGFKGTMNALYLKDLADKTRRGMRGRVAAGRSGGGRSYGYRVGRRSVSDGVTTGEREIETTEADVVRRIFRDYAGGVSPKQIAKTLNRESVPGPLGGVWSPSTIHGNPQRGTGILNDELYVGRLIWNRLRYIRDPDTGKRVSRPNPPSEWVTTAVEELRIIPDDLWATAKQRQETIRAANPRVSGKVNRELVRYHRPKVLVLGTTTCATCGGGVHVYTGNRLACYASRSPGNLHQPADDSTRRSRTTRPLGSPRQGPEPRALRRILPGVHARVESTSDGVAGASVFSPSRAGARRAEYRQTHRGHRGRRIECVYQGKAVHVGKSTGRAEGPSR